MTGGFVQCDTCKGRGTDDGCKKCGAVTVKTKPLGTGGKVQKKRRRGGKK